MRTGAPTARGGWKAPRVVAVDDVREPDVVEVRGFATVLLVERGVVLDPKVVRFRDGMV